MLARNSLVFNGFKALVTAGLLTGCIVTTGTGSGGDETTSAGTTGTGGHVSTSSTASTTGTSSSTSGTGGGVACVGETGNGVVAECKDLNVTSTTHGGAAAVNCGPNFNEEPLGYEVCVKGFEVFNTGAATTLLDCLAAIGVEDECKDTLVQACVDKAFSDECVIDTAKANCDAIKTACGADPFDAVACVTDLNPISDAGAAKLADCINADTTVACQPAYDSCYTQLLTP